jgi:hypothetical protein
MIPWLFIGNSCQLLGLAIIIGGILTIGAFTAPVMFSYFPRPEAGNAMLMIFERFDIMLTLSFALLLLGEGLRWISLGLPQWFVFPTTVRLGLMAGLIGLMMWSVYITSPKLVALKQNPEFYQQPQLQQQFNSLHKKSEQQYKAGLLLAVLLLLATSWELSLGYLLKD